MYKFLLILTLSLGSTGYFACTSKAEEKQSAKVAEHKEKPYWINPGGTTIGTRFLLPEGFSRVPVASGSFAEYLRNLELKPDGTKALLFNGQLKEPQDVYAAVINLDVGTKDLQQCADAVMRLRSEYFYKTGQFDKIQFHFTSGSLAEYTKYAEGYRAVINGSTVKWEKKEKPDNSYGTFRRYMDLVFMYSGTLSLDKELKPKADWENIQAGDVVIYGGSPGHCVIVTDVAQNTDTGEKIFLIAQSWMPAQDIHVLTNPHMRPDLSPWYSNRFDGVFYSAECVFDRNNLKSWE